MKKFLSIFVPIIILVVAVASYRHLQDTRVQDSPRQPGEKAWSVAVTGVNRDFHTPTTRLFGRVESPSLSQLKAAVNGDVTAVYALEGTRVRSGQVLVQLDDRDLRLTLRQRTAEVEEIRALKESEIQRLANDREALVHEKALLALAQRQVGRAQQLASTRAGSEAGVDDALQSLRSRALAVSNREGAINDHSPRMAQLEARLARAEAMRSQIRRDIERTAIKAPFNGRVTTVEVAVGDRVRVGDALVELYDTALLEIRAQIPNRYLTQIRGHQRSLSGTEKTFDATVLFDRAETSATLNRLAGSVERGRGGVDALFRFSDPEVDIELGRVVTLNLSLPPLDDVFALPLTAMYGSSRVYRVVDERLQPVTVDRVGESNHQGVDRVLVESEALSDGDQVLVSRLPNAVEGLLVSVVEER